MLEAVDLECVRGARRLFAGLHCKLESGDILHIRGANGAGKTSLLRILCGLSLPEAGEVRWRGATVAGNSDFHRALAYLGHRDALHGDLSALENLRAAQALAGRAGGDGDCADALRRMHLGNCLHLPCRALSAGQRRRAAIAGLLLRRGGVWLLDEPATGLDDGAVRELESILQSQAAGGGNVVFTSHRDLTVGATVKRLDLADFA